jgi:GH18 family chitinase
MRITRILAILGILGTLLNAAETRKAVVAYVPNWIDLAKFSAEIDYGKLTHLNIAFENPVNDEGDLSFNRGNDALLRTAKEKGVKVLVSIGGGSASGDKTLKARYQKLLDAENRAPFARKLAAYVVRHGFDGLDVDIEGPSITGDYGPFIDVLAAELKKQGSLLTAALSKGYGGDRVPEKTLKHFDLLHVMAYDGAGYWNPDAPGQHSSLKFAVENANYWLERGIPRDRLILGLPFYGYGFGAAFRKRDYPYKDVVANHPGAEKVDQIGNTIWYNGIPTIEAKTRHVMKENLGGVMIWSLDSDATGELSLLKAIDRVLKEKPPEI